MLGVPLGQMRLVFLAHALDRDLAVLPELEREGVEAARFGVMQPHVVGVHQAARFVETARGRTRLGLVADMPLAENRGRIALGLEHLCDCWPLRIHAALARAVSADEAGALGIAAGEERAAGGGADGLRHVKIGETATFFCQFPHVRRVVRGRAEGAEVRETGIVEEDHHDVGRTRFLPQRHTGGGQPCSGAEPSGFQKLPA